MSANLWGAVLKNCWIHGASVWGVKVNDETRQKNFNISDPNDPSAPAVAGALAEEMADEERERERIRKELIEDDDNVNEDNED